MNVWDKAQGFESAWWGDCINTFGEETKQITYAHRMGLEVIPHGGHWPVYDLQGLNVLDLGGGPSSILLKCINRGERCRVVDPLPVPDWVVERYRHAGITLQRAPAEDFLDDERYDEVWLYNVLQHTREPQQVIEVARTHAPLVRIFEWVGMEKDVGHPHSLNAEELASWLGAPGNSVVTHVAENGAVGTALYGVFTTEGNP